MMLTLREVKVWASSVTSTGGSSVWEWGVPLPYFFKFSVSKYNVIKLIVSATEEPTTHFVHKNNLIQQQVMSWEHLHLALCKITPATACFYSVCKWMATTVLLLTTGCQGSILTDMPAL